MGITSIGNATLYIDCSASAIKKRPVVPIYQPGRIVCQLVRAPEPAFSAALIAYVEAHHPDDDSRNAACTRVPFPDKAESFPRSALGNLRNEAAWNRDPALRAWIRASRLDGFGKIVGAVDRNDQKKVAILSRIRNAVAPAAENLRRLAA